ncbi:LamG-like jellyroll fold domain-containing protein [Nonomuraea dietziae]|uniref:LamG-like jellyroll fold domain-containing protein n=1 Tax=Nonomuraea dietziae TaxID=65515 RepID=UPI00343027A5
MTASLLSGVAGAAQANPAPPASSQQAAPAVTTFPRPEDPDAPLRAAIEEAKKQGKAVAVEAAYTESSRTWAYPDGHLSTQSYGGPTQLKQPDGSWSWIDTTLVEQDGVLKPKLAMADVSVSLGGDGPFAALERGKGERLALSWPSDLPRPNVSGNVATYLDGAGPGADLVVTALPTGFRHDVLLRERPKGPVEFRIPVATDKLTLRTTKTDGLQLVDGKGKIVLSAPTPLMWDAAQAKPTAGRPGRQAPIETEVETKDGSTVLVLKPDTKWLANPATLYPVTVDPTTTLGVTQEVGVRSPNSQTTPGYLERSNWQTCSGGTCTYQPTVTRALMAFDTASIANRQVVNATMQLQLRTDVYNCTPFQGISAQRITESWVANNVFWGRQPASTEEGRSSINPCSLPKTAGAWWSWDLTTMARLWASGTPNHGLVLRLTQEGAIAQNTSENFSFWPQLWGQNVPKLSVDWVLPPEIPTVTAESIDSMSGNDAIARSTNVKVTYKSSVPEATKLNYTVTVNDSTMTPPAAQLPAGEAAHWKLDEASGATAADSSGKNLPATLNGTYSRTAGQLGQAVKFSNGGYASTSNPVLNTDQSYTATAWVRLDSSTTAQTVFSQMGVHQPGFSLAYHTSSAPEHDQRWWLSMITEDVPNHIQERVVMSPGLAKIGEWTHLAAQYDQAAGKIRLYVDGALAGERDYVANWNARGVFEIGRARALGGALDGSVDDIHVYQRALTGEEIRALVGVPGTTTHNDIPSGQVLDKVFSLDNPASFKFVVKACRSGVTPPSCNESPAYRITSDAPMLPTDTETGMADPAQPIMSGMVNRPSGGPVIAKYYLYNNSGAPVGMAPLGTRTVNGGERASFQIPANTVQPGTTYKWQTAACASGQDGVGEVCTSKTASVFFTTPGTPPSDAEEPTNKLVLSKDNFVIKTAKTDPTACDGAPCTVVDDTVMRIGGTGADRTAAVIGLNLSELPDGATVTEALLSLGSPGCAPGACASDTVITANPLKSTVTAETKGSELAGDVEPGITFSLPSSAAQVDVAGSEYKWLVLTSNKEEAITFGEAAATEQPSMTLTYVTAGPPSVVLNLVASPGDGGAVASWGIPTSTGSVAILNGYDVEVTDGATTVRTLTVDNPTAAIANLTNGTTYAIKVRAKTAYGTSEWVSTTVTPKALPPATPPAGAGWDCDVTEYGSAIKGLYETQDAVLEGGVANVWAHPNGASTSRLAASLSTLNSSLVEAKQAMDASRVTRTNSSVAIRDIVVQEGPNDTVRVTAGVERRWDEISQVETAVAGVVEPKSSFTITVTVFHRCGKVEHIEVPVEAEADETDFEDYNAGGAAGPPTVFDPGDTGGSMKKIYSTPVVKYSPVKGATILMRGRSLWLKGHTGYDETTWKVHNFSGWAKLYTHPTIFWKPKVNGKYSKTEAARNKHIYYHSQLRMTARPCFKSSTTKFNFQGSIGVEYKGSIEGTLTVGVEATGDEKCPREIIADSAVGTGLIEISYASKSVEARCWQSGTQACSLPTYNHFIDGEFRLETYVSPKEDSQCHPKEPRRWNFCKKPKILPLPASSIGWRNRDGSRY